MILEPVVSLFHDLAQVLLPQLFWASQQIGKSQVAITVVFMASQSAQRNNSELDYPGPMDIQIILIQWQGSVTIESGRRCRTRRGGSRPPRT